MFNKTRNTTPLPQVIKKSARAEELEAFFETVSKSMAVIEFQPDGTILTANQNFLSCLGYTLNEIQGQHHRMFCTDELRSSNQYRQFWSSLAAGQYQAGEFLRVAKGGREVWIQASYNPVVIDGKVVKIVKHASEITKEKESSIITHGQVDAVVKSQAVIHFETDGHIVWANDHFLAATGYSLSEIVGKQHRIFCERELANSPEYTALSNAGIRLVYFQDDGACVM